MASIKGYIHTGYELPYKGCDINDEYHATLICDNFRQLYHSAVRNLSC